MVAVEMAAGSAALAVGKAMAVVAVLAVASMQLVAPPLETCAALVAHVMHVPPVVDVAILRFAVLLAWVLELVAAVHVLLADAEEQQIVVDIDAAAPHGNKAFAALEARESFEEGAAGFAGLAPHGSMVHSLL
mmetsp:Transcript_27328/g.49494  ORF Transcript_27328/g.49494 Transcript_27328/m.49494 type:complete len:133 (-) Transcript_27328:361-759(-)